MTTSIPVLLIALAAAPSDRAFTSPKSPEAEYGHRLTAKDARAGWISLFDGKTAFGWTGATVADGTLTGGNTTSAFGDVELKAEFKTEGEIRLGKSRVRVSAGLFEGRIAGGGGGSIHLGPKTAVRKLMVRPFKLKTVFNGKDFTGWKILHHPRRKDRRAKWSIVGSSIRAVGGPGALELPQKFGDLVMQIDVKTIAPLANGGVFFRSIPGDFMNGYEAQIFNACYENDPAKPARYSTGGIDDRQLARRLVSRDGKTFTMTIIAVGPHIATWVNGVQMTDWTDTRKKHENPRQGLRLKPGTIQLQAHDPKTAVEFSNIRISSIP